MQNKCEKICTIQKNVVPLHPLFGKNYSPHGSLGTQTSGVFVDRRAEAQVVRLFSGAV